VTPRKRKYASRPPRSVATERSSSFATTSSAHEKSIIPTWEKSITVSERSRESASSASIWARTAAPVGRVTRLE
jgi:hypothetical protein